MVFPLYRSGKLVYILQIAVRLGLCSWRTQVGRNTSILLILQHLILVFQKICPFCMWHGDYWNIQVLMGCFFFYFIWISEKFLTLKRFSKQKIKKLGKESQVLKEKKIVMSVNSSACVPKVLCTCADRTHAGILLNACLACPLASILHTALDESTARYCAASVVIALEDLHKVSCLYFSSSFLHCLQSFPLTSSYTCSSLIWFQKGILYRGVNPEVLMLDQRGHLQVWFFNVLCGI